MKKNYFLLIMALFLLFANFFVWKEIFSWQNCLSVTFFDVGQGDSIFLEDKYGHQILIDGGPSGKTILKKLSGKIPFWDRTIDLVVLSHPDSDHLRGLNYVLRRYKVGNILWSGAMKKTKTFKYWLENIKREKAKIFIAKKGQIIKAGDLRLEVIYPFDDKIKGKYPRQANNYSVVLLARYFNNSAIFPGDITSSVEKKIAKQGIDIQSQVLKVAHHGSKFSTSKYFLLAVKPKIAVISVGRNNPYGHPSKQVLQRLSNFGIRTLRTDKNGDIELLMDGNNIALKTKK